MRFHTYAMRSHTLSAVAVTLLSYLATSPSASADYLRDPIPASWGVDSLQGGLPSTPLPSDDGWWASFNDPLLNELISLGEQNNFNLAMARKRIETAALNLRETRAGYFPTIDASGGWTAAGASGHTGPVASDASSSRYFSLGLGLSWEIDLFGRIAAQAKGDKAALYGSRAEYGWAMVSLCANIAKAYVNLRTYQSQYDVAMTHIASQERIVNITKARHEAGLASALDVNQAEVVLYSTKATIPGLEAMISNTINNIALLCGVYPDTLEGRLREKAPLPDHLHPAPVGVPADLLRRRPDIVEAEYEIDRCAALAGVARKDYLPSLSLTGSIGTSARRFDNLFGSQSLTYQIAPQLSWTVFDGLARRYRTAEAKLQLQTAIDSYNDAVMTAISDTRTIINSYNAVLAKLNELHTVLDRSQKTFDLSLDLYKKGLSDFSNVVDAQLNVLTYQNSIVEEQGDALTDLISLYEATGGGWDISSVK